MKQVMVFRTTDWHEIVEATEGYAWELIGFEPQSWIANTNNIALRNDAGDVGLFELSADGVYNGHYFFVTRGKTALRNAKEMLKFVFDYDHVRAIRGFTPLENRKARWMTRQLGFTSYGPILVGERYCELFILTKLEHKEQN